jgi:TolC family type I secretion outer membrane protein
MLRKWLLGAILGTLGMTGSMTAQEKRVLDISEALQIAMKNNIEVITARNQYNSAVANVLPQTWGNNLPTVDFSATYSRADEKSTTSSGTKESANSYRYAVNADYIIFDGFKKYGDMAQARLDRSSAQFDFDNTRQSVVLKVYEAYVNVLKNRQLLRIGEENLKRSEEQLKRLEERNRLGAQILSDVYKQKVQVGTDKLALNKAKNNLNTSRASLNSLIGLDVNTDIELKELNVEIGTDSKENDFESALSDALQNRKDYQSSIKKLESARSALRSARGGYWPTLSAFATYSWQDAFAPRSADEYRQNDRFNIGLNFTMPLFNGFRTGAAVIQADQSVQTARSNMENTKRLVALDVKVALLNLQTALENVRLSEENVRSAKEDLRLATERYNVGAGTILDQITANTSYATAEANLIQATYDLQLARQQYLLAIGKADVE